MKWKRKALTLLLSVCLGTAGATAVTYEVAPPQAAEAYWGGIIKPSSAQERRWGQKSLEKYKKKYTVLQAEEGSPLKRMEDRFVLFNSDVLNYDDGKHKRWLEPVYLIMDEDYNWGGQYLSGGIIVLKNSMMSHLTEKPYNLVRVSGDAATMAHEMMHHVHEDGIRIGFQRSRTHELEADDGSLTLLANVPEYSMGSVFGQHLREDHNHYTNKELNQLVQRTVEEVSDGRVTLDDDGNMFYDGEPLLQSGMLEWTADADGMERTTYLAGQIATTIQKGYWHYRNLGPMRESDYLKGVNASSDRTILVACDKQGEKEGYGRVIKVLGTFDYPIDRPDKDLNYMQREAKKELQAVWDLAAQPQPLKGASSATAKSTKR